MKKLIPLFFLPVIVLYYSSCKKDTVVAPPDFSKITETDSSCLYNGNIDSTDWGNDANWSAQELSLLGFKDTFPILDSTFGFVQVSAACNNPNNGVFIVGTDVQKECTMKVAVVNKQMQILHYNTYKLTGGPIIHGFNFAGNTAFHPNEYYRLYYGFYNFKDSLFYKGHGDFRIE